MGASLSSLEEDQLRAIVAELWQQFKGANLDRVSLLEHTADSLEEGRLTRELCLEARLEAHKLGGAVGTFGFMTSSRSGKEVETLLMRWPALTPNDVRRIVELVRPLRADLEQERPEEVSD